MKRFRKYIILLLIFNLHSTFSLLGNDDVFVKKVIIQGTNQISKNEVKNNLSFTGTSWIGRRVLKNKPTIYDEQILKIGGEEIEHLYHTEGFIDVNVDASYEFTNKKKSRVKIIYNIEENEPAIIEKVRINCGDSLVFSKIESLLQKRRSLSAIEGAVFRDENVNDDQNTLKQYLIDEGYAYAQVSSSIKVDTTSNTVFLDWYLNPESINYLGEVTISGNERTPDKTILKQLAFNKGDVYSREKLNISQLQVFQLGTFHIASIQAKLGEAKNDTIPIEIVTKEAPRHSVKLGVGYGREDRVRTFIDYRILNFTGGARRLHLVAKHSYITPYHFEATFTQPAFLGPNSTISFSPNFGKVNEVSYRLFGYGANIKFQQKITNNLSASISPYYEYVKLDTTSVLEEMDLNLLLSAYSKNGVTVGAIYDNSFPKTDPNSGWSIAFNNKMSSKLFNANYPFIKLQAEVKKYIPAGNNLTLAFKLKAGTINPLYDSSVPIEERFFGGGSRSVRGWQRFMLGPIKGDLPTGGNSSFEFTFEPRINIYGPLGMVVFLDAGNIWEKSGHIKVTDLRYATGAGLRFKTPIGPIGFDVATPIFDDSKKWLFHINIGHAF